jgi:hypothetical protein
MPGESISAFHTSQPLRDILPELPGETHISSRERVANAAEGFVAGNRLDFAGPNFISPSLRLGEPHSIHRGQCIGIEAFHEQVSKSRSRFARQSHRLLS